MAELHGVRGDSTKKVSYYIPDDTIGALADNILDFILVGNIEGDLPGSPRGRVWLNHVESNSFGRGILWGIVSFKNPWDPVEKRSNAVHG